MESLSSKNKNTIYLLVVIDDFTKYAWFKPLKDKKRKTVLNAFTEIVNESNCKPNQFWVDHGRQFYNKLMHVFLYAFLDPQSWPEGSYKIGSVCPSFCSSFHLSFCPSFRPSFHLPISFLRIGSLVFSET